MPDNKEKEILEFIVNLLPIEDLDHILTEVVNKTPKLINCRGCSIYLKPELFKEYDGKVIDGKGSMIDSREIGIDFIVLAAHSQPQNPSLKVGKYFYRSGECSVGWVFKNKKILLLNNVYDTNESEKYERLMLKDKYYQLKSILAIPLLTNNQCFGVLCFFNSNNKGFSDYKETALSFGNAISRRIEIEIAVGERLKAIDSFTKIAFSNDESNAFKALVKEVKKNLNASACRFYKLDEYGETVNLEASTDADMKYEQHFKRGEGLIGWIFKTGEPFFKNEVDINEKISLHDDKLRKYSLYNDLIEEGNKTVEAIEKDLYPKTSNFSHFLGVPVSLSQRARRIHCVVVALSTRDDRKEFEEADLYLLQKYAKIISLFLKNIRNRKFNDILFQIAYESNKDRIFQYITEGISKLVFARGCSIFLKSDKENSLYLEYTSSSILKNNKVTPYINSAKGKQVSRLN